MVSVSFLRRGILCLLLSLPLLPVQRNLPARQISVMGTELPQSTVDGVLKMASIAWKMDFERLSGEYRVGLTTISYLGDFNYLVQRGTGESIVILWED